LRKLLFEVSPVGKSPAAAADKAPETIKPLTRRYWWFKYDECTEAPLSSAKWCVRVAIDNFTNLLLPSEAFQYLQVSSCNFLDLHQAHALLIALAADGLDAERLGTRMSHHPSTRFSAPLVT
jgi:hypothetical protein